MAGKRKNYISKDELYMGIARFVSKRSKDPNTQVGAVIVSQDDRILSLGYNGFPNGISDDDPNFSWAREGETELDTKYPFVAHAEANAILNFRGDLKALSGSILYVTLFPCHECAKQVIQVGISKIVYLSNKYEGTTDYLAAKRMFDAVGIELVQYKPSFELMSNVINSVMILGNSPKYRNIASSDNIEKVTEDWYNDLFNCIR